MLAVCMMAMALSGCSTKSEMSKEDVANFRGGPPTAEYLAGAAKRKAEAEKRVPDSFKAWQEKRNAALGKQGTPAGVSTAPGASH
jgi:hypothetical protein